MSGKESKLVLVISRIQPTQVSWMMSLIQAAFRREGLVGVEDGRFVGGVVAGLGRRLGLDRWPARLLFALMLM
jgi:hypothetical protein